MALELAVERGYYEMVNVFSDMLDDYEESQCHKEENYIKKVCLYIFLFIKMLIYNSHILIYH